MNRVGLYTGSFDPLTNGHVDVIDAASRLCDRLVIGIGVNPAKTPLFSAEERAQFIDVVCAEPARQKGCVVETMRFDGLAVEAARSLGASIIIRGVRDGTDLDYEMQMVGMNAAMAPEIRTVFVPASLATRAVTATLVRQIVQLGGDVVPFVPPAVAAAIAARRSGN